jgi:hypothetical protein
VIDAATLRRAMPPWFWRIIDRPILLSQALSSLTGALTVFLGVSWMTQGDYALFAVLNLASNMIFGFVRVVVFQPALIHYRSDKSALTPPQYALWAGLSGAVVLGGAGLLLGVDTFGEALLLGASLLAPVGQDWLRYRCLVVGKVWRTALGELCRALATILILVTATGANPAAYQALANVACLFAMIVQVGGHARTSAWTPFRDYRRAALLQSVDYTVGTLNSIIPMLILGALGGGLLIGGFRLAQTIFGPLNLLFSASSTKLLADGAVQDSHASDAALVGAGRQLALRMSMLSGGLVLSGASVVAFSKIHFSGVSHDALLIGVLCVGAVAVTSGWAGIHNVLMRMLGFNRQVTVGRSIVVATAWVAFSLGYVFGGVDGSVVAGFSASAIMYPIAFVLPARSAYRKVIGGSSDD